MRIKQLEIYGYGKWVDQTFHLSNNVQHMGLTKQGNQP